MYLFFSLYYSESFFLNCALFLSFLFFNDFFCFFRLVQAQFEDPQSQQAGHGSSHGLQGRRPGGRGAG